MVVFYIRILPVERPQSVRVFRFCFPMNAFFGCSDLCQPYDGEVAKYIIGGFRIVGDTLWFHLWKRNETVARLQAAYTSATHTTPCCLCIRHEKIQTWLTVAGDTPLSAPGVLCRDADRARRARHAEEGLL